MADLKSVIKLALKKTENIADVDARADRIMDMIDVARELGQLDGAVGADFVVPPVKTCEYSGVSIQTSSVPAVQTKPLEQIRAELKAERAAKSALILPGDERWSDNPAEIDEPEPVGRRIGSQPAKNEQKYTLDEVYAYAMKLPPRMEMNAQAKDGNTKRLVFNRTLQRNEFGSKTAGDFGGSVRVTYVPASGNAEDGPSIMLFTTEPVNLQEAWKQLEDGARAIVSADPRRVEPRQIPPLPFSTSDSVMGGVAMTTASDVSVPKELEKDWEGKTTRLVDVIQSSPADPNRSTVRR